MHSIQMAAWVFLAVSIRSIVRIIHSSLASSAWPVQFQAARANRNIQLQQSTAALVCTQGPRSLPFSLPGMWRHSPHHHQRPLRPGFLVCDDLRNQLAAPELQAAVWISICSDLAICDQEVAIPNSHSFLPSAGHTEPESRP